MDLGFESNEELRTLSATKKASKLAVQAVARVGQTWQTTNGNLVIGAVFNHGVSASLDGKITDFEDLVRMLQHESGADLQLDEYIYCEDYALVDAAQEAHGRDETETEFWYRDRWITEEVADELKLDPHELPLVRFKRKAKQ